MMTTKQRLPGWLPSSFFPNLMNTSTFIIFAVAVALSPFSTEACTVFIVGKDATQDGSTLVSHSNDGDFTTDPRLVRVPAAQYDIANNNEVRNVYFSPEAYPRYVGTYRGVPEYFPTGDQEPFVPIGTIPQVAETYAYLEDTYGAVNEHQVAIGESTCSGVFGAEPITSSSNGEGALFSIDELSHIAMERAKTARQAIQIMGALAEEHGFYGAGQFEGTAESLAVSDPQEAWIFHILPDPTGKSAIWAAQRVPDNAFAVLANMFVIRKVDPNDSDNFLMSESVHSVAMEYGWWSNTTNVDNEIGDDGLLDFTKIYSDGEYSHKYYSGRRMWGGYRLVGRDFPDEYVDLQSDPVYPVYTTPTTLLTEQDLFRFHRYSYQDTPYDLGAAENLAAGPFGSPDRWTEGAAEAELGGSWERPIGLFRTSDTYVVKAKAGSATGGVLWFAPAAPTGSVFTPFVVVGTEIVPPSFSTGHQAVFDRSTAFWAACYVHNLANMRWNLAIQDVQKRQLELEAASAQMVASVEAAYAIDGNVTAVQEAYLDNAAAVVDSLWSLADEILFKYASGFVDGEITGYPAWWLREVGFLEGPPPPPTEPKCCDPPKNETAPSFSRDTGNAQILRSAV